VAKASPQDDWKEIRLSAKVFGYLSQGLYRTPAASIKELISNSFDADATTVKIHTGFPNFETFTCEDDGTGIAIDQFEGLMNRGIGTSFKRTMQYAVTNKYRRPVIGRLGIGILALAQICSRFDIISHHGGSRAAFSATIEFPPYTKEDIDKLPKSANGADDDLVVPGGKYRLETVTYDASMQGVRIYTNFLREQFRKRMRDLSNFGNLKTFKKKAGYRDFQTFIEACYGKRQKTRSISWLSHYDQLIFGLALASPLPYFEEGQGNVVLRLPPFKGQQQTLKNYNFSVELDHLTLARPVLLPSDRENTKEADCQIEHARKRDFELSDGSYREKTSIIHYPIRVEQTDLGFSLYEILYKNERVAGRPLHFWGYLFQQTGRVYPREIQGVLIRLRNVAIGNYDADIMKYPLAEGPRYSMISGEVNVVTGFEDALNIDRESFNELHPHFIRVQSYIHSVLHEIVFPETWSEEKLRNVRRRSQRDTEREKSFMAQLRDSTKEEYRKIERPERKIPSSREEAAVRFHKSNKTVEIDRNHPVLQKILRRKKYASLVERIVIAFETSNLESAEGSRREMFYKLLGDIFLKL